MVAPEFHQLYDMARGLEVRNCNAALMVHSRLRGGKAVCGPLPGIAVRYVARGEERYDFGRRSQLLQSGDLLLSRARDESEIHIAETDGGLTEGMCLFLPDHGDYARILPGAPLLLPAECSALGRTIASLAAGLGAWRSPSDLPATMTGIGRLLAALETDVSRATSNLGMARRGAGLRQYAGLERARTLLHRTSDRAVETEELAEHAGISRFQLIRNFKLAFGATPAAYHRRLRLQRARAAISRGEASCQFAAQRFGFADGASFSRAYRSEFGRPPLADRMCA